MKKFAKLSLVAAVAVAGLSTTSSAASLEEAIKGVDISGAVRYRMEDASKGGAGTEDQDVNIDVKIKVPVTDTVTFVANANFDDDNQETQTAVSEANNTVKSNGTASDTSGTLDQYYFQYANGPVTVLLGTQDIPGRLTDSEEASGIVGLYNLGAATVGAAAFYNADLTSEAIYSVIAMGNVGPVSLLAQYVDADDVASSYNVKADVSVDMIKAGVEYSETDLDANNNEYETFKAYVSAKAGIVSGTVSYASTGDNGSGSLHAAATGSYAASAETPAEFLLWQLGSATKADLDVFAIDASVAVTDKISVRAAYADGEYGATDTDITETLGQVSYKVAKNLNTYFRYSELEEEGQADKTRGRIEVNYSF